MVVIFIEIIVEKTKKIDRSFRWKFIGNVRIQFQWKKSVSAVTMTTHQRQFQNRMINNQSMVSDEKEPIRLVERPLS